MKKAKVGLIIVGIAAVLLALQGFWYNFSTLFVAFSGKFSDISDKFDTPYFYPAFYTMSLICISCYIILLISGIQFTRQKMGMLKIFIGTLVFEVIYFFSIGMFWLIPKIGMSIGVATGVANGGLVFQGILLFPIWAPWVVIRSSKQTKESE